MSAEERVKSPLTELKEAVDELVASLYRAEGKELGAQLIKAAEMLDRLKALYADGLRRLEKAHDADAKQILEKSATDSCRNHGSGCEA
jgi:heme oxygenase